MIRAGKYRHRIEIQHKVETQDENTGVIDHTWQTVTVGSVLLNAVPAEVLTGPGREVHAAGTKLAETSARINLRWFPGLTEKMRILWDGEFDSDDEYTGKIYDIISIETDATARREYRLRCKDGLTLGE